MHLLLGLIFCRILMNTQTKFRWLGKYTMRKPKHQWSPKKQDHSLLTAGSFTRLCLQSNDGQVPTDDQDSVEPEESQTQREHVLDLTGAGKIPSFWQARSPRYYPDIVLAFGDNNNNITDFSDSTTQSAGAQHYSVYKQHGIKSPAVSQM